jgi:hypothetical protein
MNSLSIFTSMTNPEARNDPWKEALSCYESLADEVVIVGKDWPYDFSWDFIGKTFQKGFDECNSDWVIRMDIDYFFHENDFYKIRNALEKYKEYPMISFPQYQFFSYDRYQIKTRIGLAFNKKKFPNIKLNSGGDLTLASLNNKLIDPKSVPNLFVPVYQYDSVFRTKEILLEDRFRFAKAWYEYFDDYGGRGGDSKERAFESWYQMVLERYPKHSFKINLEEHPKFIQTKLSNIQKDQFGFDLFGLKEKTAFPFKYKLKGLKEKYINHFVINSRI